VLHARALVTANLGLEGLLLARLSVRIDRACFGSDRVVLGFGGRREHAFVLGAFFLFLELRFFFGCVRGIVRGFFRVVFGGRFGHFPVFFALHRVVHRTRGIIRGREASLFGIALGNFFLCLGHVLGQRGRFLRAQVRDRRFSRHGSAREFLRLVDFRARAFAQFDFLLRFGDGSGCGRFDVQLIAGRTALPFRK
jgi:hypothetical protein